MAWYLDTSAAVKLVARERGSAAMSRWADRHANDVVSSDLLRTELLRATRRSMPELMPRARLVLDGLTLMQLSADVLERAAELEPWTLRSLDAVHLAAALTLGDDLDGIVTYDERLAAAASLHGLVIIAPA